MRRRCKSLAALLLALSAGAACGDTPPAMPQAAIRSDVLPGSGHGWGFGALDPTRPFLFIARRENGLTVFDTAGRKLVKDIPGTAGANAVAFAPALDRAFVAYMDGALGILRLSDMVQLQRIPVDAGNLNNAVFDAASGKLILTGGRREQRSAIYRFDPAIGRITGKREFDARKFDAPLGLADGSVLVPLRDEGRVMRISAATLAPLPGWSGKQFNGCEHPSALAADESRNRLFIACRGKAPQLTVARLDDGAPIAALPATPAINALAWDAARRELLIPSGNAASLSILQLEEGKGDGKAGEYYRMLGHIGTRPWAHNMVYDAGHGVAHLFTMEFTQPAPDAAGVKQDPQFHADSFTVMSITLGQPAQ